MNVRFSLKQQQFFKSLPQMLGHCFQINLGFMVNLKVHFMLALGDLS